MAKKQYTYGDQAYYMAVAYLEETDATPEQREELAQHLQDALEAWLDENEL